MFIQGEGYTPCYEVFITRLFDLSDLDFSFLLFLLSFSDFFRTINFHSYHSLLKDIFSILFCTKKFVEVANLIQEIGIFICMFKQCFFLKFEISRT